METLTLTPSTTTVLLLLNTLEFFRADLISISISISVKRKRRGCDDCLVQFSSVQFTGRSLLGRLLCGVPLSLSHFFFLLLFDFFFHFSSVLRETLGKGGIFSFICVYIEKFSHM